MIISGGATTTTSTTTLKTLMGRVNDHFERLRPQVVRPAQGAIPFPYCVPSGFYQQLWDWDGFFIALHFLRRQPAQPEYMRDWVLNFVTLSDAVREVSEGGGVDRYLRHAAALKPKWVPFKHYPEPILLAMEMALFEGEERRALEGELDRLIEAWREAEEIAAISDSLILPKGWEAFKAEVKASGKETPSTLGDDVDS